tara:strand:- start:172 stop:573 length:402 start_codon:yes stop_codon:yes gene_type:complete
VIDPYFFGNGMEEIHINAAVKGTFPETKSYRIINAYMDANLLYLELEYRASCVGSDDFQFIGGALTYDEMGFAHREARLSIGKTRESCDLINETKIVDLRELTSAHQRDAEVILHIGGWRTDMTYVYIPYKKN